LPGLIPRRESAVARSFSGRRLREIRTAAGIRREALAVAVDRSYSSIVKWERYEGIPTANDVGRIALVLGIGVEDLFDEPAGAVA
jgi:transcriptional regulator with XRE-family HTH domain